MGARRGLWLCLTILILSSLVPSLAPAQAALGEQDRFARAREVDATKEQIRRLFAEGRYEDVIKAADHLLTLDPDNQQAVFWKDLGERKIMTGDTPPSIFAGSGDATPVPMLRAEELIDRSRQNSAASGSAQSPTQKADSRPRSSYRSRRQLPMGVILGLVVGVVVLLAIAIIAWIMFRSARRRLQTALQQVRLSRNLDQEATVHSGGMADQPTHVAGGGEDEQTSVTHHGFGFGQADEQTVAEQGDIMSSLSVGPDEESRFDAGGGGVGFPDGPTLHEEGEDLPLQFSPVEDEKPDFASGESQIGDVQEVEGDTFASLATQDEDESISLGGGEPPEEEDENSKSYNSLMFAGDETKLPESAPEEQSQAEPEDASSMSYNSLMFAEETKMPQAPPPEESQASLEDTNALSYNSLMFDGDESKMPQAEQPAEAEDPSMSYNSLMFPGEETVMPDEKNTPAKAQQGEDRSSSSADYENMMFGEGSEQTKDLEEPVDASLYDTIKIEGGLSLGGISLGDPSIDETIPQDRGSVSGEEVTMQLPGRGDSDPQQTFANQKNAGKQALTKGNYSRAVECLSVAASLRPGDQEVSKMLDEAKRKRNA